MDLKLWDAFCEQKLDEEAKSQFEDALFEELDKNLTSEQHELLVNLLEVARDVAIDRFQQ